MRKTVIKFGMYAFYDPALLKREIGLDEVILLFFIATMCVTFEPRHKKFTPMCTSVFAKLLAEFRTI